VLLLFGVVMVYDASVVYAQDVFGGKYHFLLLQTGWVGLGIFFAAIVYKIGYRNFSRFGTAFFGASLVLLFFAAWPNIPILKHLLIIPRGIYDRFFPEIYGARRWLILIPGKISFQPSELAKFSSIVYFSTWLSTVQRAVLKFLIPLGLMSGLILFEPDYGTAMVFAAIGLCIYFVSGAHLLKLLPLGVVLAGLALVMIVSSPYRMQRLQTYLNPSTADPLSSGYHIQQILIAVGSGGAFGLGFGQSRQKYDYLPEVSTDSIFAVISEELGFAGALVVVAAFAFLIYKSFSVARSAADDLGKLIATGAGSWLGIQVLVNLAAMTALLPLTGIPLPLISYGGSSMIFMMMAMGLLLSVSRYSVRSAK
jgi:cell division protein FtsW